MSSTMRRAFCWCYRFQSRSESSTAGFPIVLRVSVPEPVGVGQRVRVVNFRVRLSDGASTPRRLARARHRRKQAAFLVAYLRRRTCR